MKTLKQQARSAGYLYLALALIAPIGLMLVPDAIIVTGNAAATADNLRASEGLFRIGVASELTHQAIAVFLVLALYRLFKSVNETLARQLVILGALVSVPSGTHSRISSSGCTAWASRSRRCSGVSGSSRSACS